MKGNFSGIEVSKTTNLPLGFSTLNISESPFSKSSKLRTPKPTVTASKVASAKGNCSLSPCTKFMRFESCFLAIFSRPTASIPSEMSNPVIFTSGIVVSAIAKSPVPVATSNTVEGLISATFWTTNLRHFTSDPQEITRFKPS